MLTLALLLIPLSCLIFSAVNEVDSHNKPMYPDLALEKFWVTHFGWIRLYTTVAMGITITNCCKLFLYGINRYHYEKLIGIR